MYFRDRKEDIPSYRDFYSGAVYDSVHYQYPLFGYAVSGRNRRRSSSGAVYRFYGHASFYRDRNGAYAAGLLADFKRVLYKGGNLCYSICGMRRDTGIFGAQTDRGEDGDISVAILFSVYAGVKLFGVFGIVKGPLALITIYEIIRHGKEQVKYEKDGGIL